jgi:hypothetical protein
MIEQPHKTGMFIKYKFEINETINCFFISHIIWGTKL